MLTLLAFLFGTSLSAAPAEHRIKLVTLTPQTTLEVLDWGGRGPALVFLAGFGSTGHIFDDFAPQFTNRYRVIAITRRGFGASSRPVAGYDTRTLAQDIRAVLDTLGIRRAHFVGHSFAGTELSYLGVHHKDRVQTLSYIDASYDFGRLYDDPRWKRAFPVDRPSAPTSSGLPELRRWYGILIGAGVPDHEIRNMTSSRPVPGIERMLQDGAFPTDLADIEAPVVAFWATPNSVSDWYPYWSTLDSIKRERLQHSYNDQMSVRAEHVRAFGERVSNAQIVKVSGGRHFLLLTHGKQLAAQLRGFFSRYARN